jgi:hypothetical protein
LLFCSILAGTLGSPADASLGAALITAIVAYVVGLVLHELVRPWVPSQSLGGRLPSDALLDSERLPEWVRSAYIERAVHRFGVSPEMSPGDRAQAFLLARTALVQRGLGRYAEQFQSMQALCRGLFGALLLGSGWLVGIGTSVGPAAIWLIAALGVWFAAARATGALDRLFDAGSGRARLMAAHLVLLLAGWLLSPLQSGGPALLALAVAGASMVAAKVARDAHDRYAERFAAEVIRGFVALDPPSTAR